MRVTSREITYRTTIEQVFFDDDSELIIKTGWAEGDGGELDITVTWVTPEPKWAEGMTPQQLDELTREEANV